MGLSQGSASTRFERSRATMWTHETLDLTGQLLFEAFDHQEKDLFPPACDAPSLPLPERGDFGPMPITRQNLVVQHFLQYRNKVSEQAKRLVAPGTPSWDDLV